MRQSDDSATGAVGNGVGWSHHRQQQHKQNDHNKHVRLGMNESSHRRTSHNNNTTTYNENKKKNDTGRDRSDSKDKKQKQNDSSSQLFGFNLFNLSQSQPLPQSQSQSQPTSKLRSNPKSSNKFKIQATKDNKFIVVLPKHYMCIGFTSLTFLCVSFLVLLFYTLLINKNTNTNHQIKTNNIKIDNTNHEIKHGLIYHPDAKGIEISDTDKDKLNINPKDIQNTNIKDKDKVKNKIVHTKPQIKNEENDINKNSKEKQNLNDNNNNDHSNHITRDELMEILNNQMIDLLRDSENDYNNSNIIADPVPVFIPEYWTIFVSIYSFRESFCISTVQSLLLNSTFPDRIHIGIREEKDKENKYNCDQFDLKCPDLRIKRDLYYQYLKQKKILDYQKKALQDSKNIQESRRRILLNDKESNIMVTDTNGESIYKLTQTESKYLTHICDNVDHVEVETVDWEYSKGESYGRYRSEEYYDDETFVLSIDGHFMFVENWDVLLIEEWSATNNEFSILTTYPNSISSYIINPHSISYIPVVCNTYFLDWSLRHMLQNNVGSMQFRYHPILTTLYASSFSFSKGHRLSMVRYDPYYNSLLDGNEFDMAIRLFTFGYDFYSPHIFLIWNMKTNFDPASKKQKFRKLWRYKWKEKNYAMIKSTHRLRQKIGIVEYIEQDQESSDYDNDQIQLYGLGDIRTIKQYLNFAGINLIDRKIINKCPVIRDGTLERVRIINKWNKNDILLLRNQEVRRHQDHP